jgi:hypothetical protein
MALEAVGLERIGQANMPSRSLLPRPQGVGKKNQSGYFMATPCIFLTLDDFKNNLMKLSYLVKSNRDNSIVPLHLFY